MKLLFSRTFAVALVLVLTATGLWAGSATEEAPAAAADKEMVTDPATGEMVSAPEYGGTITYGRVSWAEHCDVWYISGWATHNIGLVNEMLGIGNWAMDRDIWDWRVLSDQPLSAWRGALAESWETPDDTTIIFNIRQGVHWHDKAPMNGRELTAKDVEYNWQRLLGLGKFSEAGASLMAGGFPPEDFESVTATDDWTVVFKLNKPNFHALTNLLGQWIAVIYPPEVIEEHGDYKDWRNTVGTGPYALTEVVEESSRTWTKNPNYWGYDPKYPDNRLPYTDKVVTLLMPEAATRLAALRAGQLDMLGTVGDSQLRSIDEVESLTRTNPEIVLQQYKFRSDNVFFLVGLQRPPWDDIRVRQAMQMALDLDTVVETYYKGYGDATPQGRIGNDVAGIGTPFEEWPEDVKKTYRYDPEGAEALLDAAGYPRGADGIRFKTGMAYFERYDVSYAELAAGYWREIGVDVEIDVFGVGETGAVTADQDTYRISWGEGAFRYSLPNPLTWAYYSERTSRDGLQDPEYDAMIDAMFAASTLDEQNRLAKEANMYIIENQFRIWGPETPQFQATQPWIIGYNGEMRIGNSETQSFLAYLWIDSALKAAMGH
jgi:peptide/nickel transport system substrate-binding protein